MNIDSLCTKIKFQLSQNEKYADQFCRNTHKDTSWKTAIFRPQQFEISFDQEMAIKSLLIHKFELGAELTVEMRLQSSYVAVLEKEFVPAGNPRAVNLGWLPCQGIRVTVSKGVHINTQNLQAVGVPTQELKAKGPKQYQLLVEGPRKIIYF